ncbi:MAG TPA: hypothetical protein VFO85_22820 [Vicinamibacteria bacterium]|nr:hypothetical protein [Vicinamibacteria bacterium]
MILSLYEFEREAPERAGPFRETHLSFEGSAALGLPTGEPQSLLVRVREEAEEVLDLFDLFNAEGARARLQALLEPPLHVIGPLRLSYVPWEAALVQPLAPARHGAAELLATVNLEFHAALPASLDVDGALVYYAAFWIDRGSRLQGAVEGGAFQFRGGLPGAAPAVSAALQRALRAGSAEVQAVLDSGLRGFTRERRFRSLDLLPGRGGRRGRRRWGNADRQVVLAAVPL